MLNFFYCVVFPALGFAMVTSSGARSEDKSATPAVRDAPLSEIFLHYPGGWGDDNAAHRISIDTVNLHSYDGQTHISINYDRCRRCRANAPQRVSFTLPLAKMDEINALIDMQEIEAALSKPCTLPRASNWHQTMRVRVLRKGDVKGPTPILLPCRSPELDQVRGKLDRAMGLVEGWLLQATFKSASPAAPAPADIPQSRPQRREPRPAR